MEGEGKGQDRDSWFCVGTIPCLPSLQHPPCPFLSSFLPSLCLLPLPLLTLPAPALGPAPLFLLPPFSTILLLYLLPSPPACYYLPAPPSMPLTITLCLFFFHATYPYPCPLAFHSPAPSCHALPPHACLPPLFTSFCLCLLCLHLVLALYSHPILSLPCFFLQHNLLSSRHSSLLLPAHYYHWPVMPALRPW